MTQIELTAHATKRLKQRGIPHQDVQLVLGHYDIDFTAGGGCHIFRLSRRASAGCSVQGVSPQRQDRLSRMAVVCNEADQVVTVLYDKRGRAGRHYRRSRK